MALVTAALGVPAVAWALPGAPVADPNHQPSIASVQRRLGELALQNSQLVEKFDRAQAAVRAKQAAATRAAAKAARADTEFEKARGQLGVTLTAIYERGAFSATGALLTSDSEANYLDKLTTLSMLSNHTAQIVRNLETVQHRADAAKRDAAKLLETATAKRDQLADQRKHVQAELDKYSKLLDSLTAAQRASYLRRVSPSVSSSRVSAIRAHPPTATSAAAAQAVEYALAQVGKPYVFGAAGPDTYDCSGLTMAAWASAGVSLPHSAAGQYNYGTHVSFSQLQPGDLLFFYRPISHVTIYVGDGLMVSAPQSGQDVAVVPANQFGSSFVGATRLTAN